MKFKIITDNMCELTDKIKNSDLVEIIDTAESNESSSKYLKVILNNMNFGKKEFPEPEAFKKAYETEADIVFVVTMSRKLSGAFCSAVIGRSIYFEQQGENKKIKVFDSNAVSRGEAAIIEKLIDCIEADMNYEDICSAVRDVKKELSAALITETVEYMASMLGVQAEVVIA